jgi:hypothetical protein
LGFLFYGMKQINFMCDCLSGIYGGGGEVYEGRSHMLVATAGVWRMGKRCIVVWLGWSFWHVMPYVLYCELAFTKVNLFIGGRGLVMFACHTLNTLINTCSMFCSKVYVTWTNDKVEANPIFFIMQAMAWHRWQKVGLKTWTNWWMIQREF